MIGCGVTSGNRKPEGTAQGIAKAWNEGLGHATVAVIRDAIICFLFFAAVAGERDPHTQQLQRPAALQSAVAVTVCGSSRQ